jgi:RNA polymerase sigma factor (sigma-70 family)
VDKLLTAEQQKLVEDNHNLIYGYCQMHRISPDEYYDLLAIELCEAAQNYDDSKGNFSTVAYKYMENALRLNHLYNHRQMRDPANIAISLDEPLSNNSEFSAIIGYDCDFTDVEAREFVSRLTAREKFVLSMLLQGAQRSEIMEALGKSHTTVHKIRTKIREKFIDYLRPKPCTASRDSKIIELRQSGKTLGEIAYIMKLPRASVQSKLRKENVYA